MVQVKEYHRPTDLDEALRLLQRSEVATIPLAGGSWLVPRLQAPVSHPVASQVEALVDLGGLGLSYLQVQEDASGQAWLHLGATTTLAAIAQDATCRELAGGLLAQGASAEGPVNLRNTATVAGTVIAATGESELVLALLVLEAQAVIQGAHPQMLSLSHLFSQREAVLHQGLITEIRLPVPPGTARGGMARVARTPDDHPIVAAAALVDGASLRVALGGVAAQPMLLRLSDGRELDETLSTALDIVSIPEDFRGSSQYRRTMAPLIAHRAIAAARA